MYDSSQKRPVSQPYDDATPVPHLNKAPEEQDSVVCHLPRELHKVISSSNDELYEQSTGPSAIPTKPRLSTTQAEVDTVNN
jgi:hypothetical protein